jgi:DNA polymerase (family 10)
MKNAELSALFAELADILEYAGENPFKLNAYRKAARVLDDLTEDIEVVAREGRLRELDGIGEAIAKKIVEYLDTGKVVRYEEAKKGMPPGLLEMLRVPGLGPKTIAQLHKALRIETLKELEEAARAGKIRELPGMGAKKEVNILRGLGVLAQGAARMLLGEALPIVEQLIGQLRTAGVKQIVYAGSLRRMKETIGDIDILAAGSDGPALVHAFCQLPDAREVLAEGPTKGSIRTTAGHQADLRVVESAAFGAAWQYFTGSKAHNIRLRDLAKRAQLKVNEYGVFRGEKRLAGKTEAEVYAALGLPWIPPELREDRGEIDAALAGRLPRLLESADIRGDLHVHTNWSDGHADIETMARAAQARGYDYVVISDHTRALKVFGGLTAERLLEQVAAIRKADALSSGIRILAGIEVDIKADGALDLPDAALAKLDFVTASVHSGFKQDRDTMTRRILTAIRHPRVNAIGHLTGRLIGHREAYDVDLDAIAGEAARCNVALEVNAQPDRLDLGDQACRRVRELGARLAINTDAHDPDQLDYMRLGVATARRGWTPREDVLNACSLAELRAYLDKRRTRT